MSSILKALKRLEEERAGQSGPAGGQYVAPPRHRRSPQQLLWAVCIGAGLLLVAGGYWWLAGRERGHEPARASVAQPSPPAPAAPPSTAPTRPAQPAAVPAAPVPPPVVAGQTAAPPGAAAPKSVIPGKAGAVPGAGALPPARPDASAAKAAAAPMPVEQVQVERRQIPAPGEQWAAPHLVVSEILSAGGDGRMAIVNGLPVMEGTLVEDALVREIGTDRVLFEIGGKVVAVPVAGRR